MTLPAWVSPLGLLEHLVAGAVLTVTFGMLCPSGAVLALVAIIALTHEHAQTNWSDFRKANGGPYNGLADVGSFLLVPLAYVLM